ncbi:ABC transporter substrate-binding protein [Clostridium paridis]|uniref:Extracellular solute-binding protein n=1 Tax=Clostridium paridis TaxID=2803863 RepID=A0A937FBW8_9CLOT|nr:extracellular solute-binding protein [Clostridium paridis]MBL4930259.1 extracellular solute-binding protein [Clostridium paridis]
MFNFVKRNVRFFIFFFVILVGAIIYKSYMPLNDVKETEDPLMKGKEVVNVWLYKDESSETFEYLANKFNQENNEIFIKTNIYYKDYANILKTSMVNSDKVDIAQYGFYQMFTNKQLLNLKDIGLYNKQNRDPYYYYDGEPYGIQISSSTIKLIWNKDIFKKVGIDASSSPKTWSELISICEKIKDKDPSITPIEVKLNDIEDVKALFGEPSAKDNANMYASLWNYKDGKYDVDGMKNIISVYKELYSKNLIKFVTNKDDKVTNKYDFANKRVAITLSSSNEKNFYVSTAPLDFELGISDLPVFNLNKQDNSFYYLKSKTLVINAQVKPYEDKEKLKSQQEHFDAVKKVMEYLISNESSSVVLKSNTQLPSLLKDKDISTLKYGEFFNDSKYDYEVKDPSAFVDLDSKTISTILLDAIKDKLAIEDAIKQLNDQYGNALKTSSDYGNIDIDKYKE